MNSEQTELFRISILRVLDDHRSRYGLTLSAIAHLVSIYGHKPTTDELLDALDYLAGKGLVEEALKQISRENRAWRITQNGIAFLDQHG